MKTIYAKSPCCCAQIYWFGGKRRQCSCCKRTWTIRPKKRGRPIINISTNVLNQVFLEKYTLTQLASRRSKVGLPSFRYRFRQALNRFIAKPNPIKLPKGPLILLADGIWFHFGDKHWVLYLTALKSCSERTAVFLDPVLLPGREGANRWKQVFAAIPEEPRLRIKALVVDNLQGMKLTAKQEGWALQLCHFHLILKLQVQRRKESRALIGGKVRERIYRLICRALVTSNKKELGRLISDLRRFTQVSCGTRRIQAVVQEFIQSIEYYRMYLHYPDLNLPITTNTVESMCCIIRDLFRRNRSASNPSSLLRWATALIRLRPSLVCNGKIFNRIN